MQCIKIVKNLKGIPLCSILESKTVEGVDEKPKLKQRKQFLFRSKWTYCFVLIEKVK